jgi:DNA polymerase-1
MKTLYILDASGYLYRSYFAIRNITNDKGESTNAIYGFIRSIMRLFKDFHPEYFVAVFDGPDNSKSRKAIYPEYKAHRSSMPPDLIYQINWAKAFCDLAGIPSLNIAEVEADDTMGSVAIWAEKQGATVYMCTSDKDMCQLVNDKIFILNTHKENLVLGPKEIEATYGVKPSQIIDFLAIVGDTSDNVPGITGFGPKTAASLLQQFGSLDVILENPQLIPLKRKQEILIQESEKVRLSRKLVTVDTSVPFPYTEEFFKLKQPELATLKEFYSKLNFHSLLKDMEENPFFTALAPDSAEKEKKCEEITDYQIIKEASHLNELIELLIKEKEICVNILTESDHPLKSDILAIAFCVGPETGKACYIPAEPEFLQRLKPLFESDTICFYGHEMKKMLHALANKGISLGSLSFDTHIASYLLNSSMRHQSLTDLSMEYFGKSVPSLQDLIGKGKKVLNPIDLPVETLAQVGCAEADYTCRLKKILEKQLAERHLKKLFVELELALTPLLFRMERNGIHIDLPYLKNLSVEIGKKIEKVTEEIYLEAGEHFNLNSPKQLSHILFTKMGIPPLKKIASGHSTNADVLESLKGNYPIAFKLLEYRQLEKLRSTYIDALPSEIEPKTGRIHCTFNQTGTATGRLACQNPNLQNIPVRSEEGKKIRAAFRPEKSDWSYLAGDYSQIELRILAHLSEDPILLEAFNNNEDIHSHTASVIFNVPLDKVTPEERHRAKAVNFGVIYGQQAFGLAQELNISAKEAASFIDIYFKRYKQVKEFVEECKEKTRQTGKAVTITGRERAIPEIHSKNGVIRSAAERLSVNTPLQGSAADIIKMAMLSIDKKMKVANLRSFMILQIHDELIFEAPDGELPLLKTLVLDAMQQVYPLKIPLIVDIVIGKNWKEC